MSRNKEIAKMLVGKRKGDAASADEKDGANDEGNDSPDGLEHAMASVGKALAAKDFKGAADAFRSAHDICAGQGETSSGEY